MLVCSRLKIDQSIWQRPQKAGSRLSPTIKWGYPLSSVKWQPTRNIDSRAIINEKAIIFQLDGHKKTKREIILPIIDTKGIKANKLANVHKSQNFNNMNSGLGWSRSLSLCIPLFFTFIVIYDQNTISWNSILH